MAHNASRIPPVLESSIKDPELLQILARAQRFSTPKPAWYLTLAHSPEMAKAYAAFWDVTHRGGRVDHRIKELMRIAIAQLLGCAFCADQRSVLAQEQGLEESDALVCARADFDSSDPRTRGALRFARALTLDDPTADGANFDGIYSDLREVFDEGEIVELGCFAAIAIGGVKLSRSLRIEP